VNSTTRYFVLGSALLTFLPGLGACTSQTAGTRGIGNSDGLAQKKGNGEIVIFYANETPQDSRLESLYSRIRNATMAAQQSRELGSGEKSTLSRIERSYANDIVKFPVQVEKDARGLESQICGEANTSRKTGLFIFSNRLARAGKVRFCLPGPYAGRVEEIEFNVGLNAMEAQDFRYSEMPLSSEKSFNNALDFVKTTLLAKGIGPSDLAYVLISKSHGGGDYVIAPKLSYRVDLLSDEALLQRYTKVATNVTIHDVRLVDLVLENGQRLGDVVIGGIRLEDLLVPAPKGQERGLKIGDLKIGDLDLGADRNAFLASLKVGDLKVGDLKIGDLKVGDLKVGDLKVGDLKTGDLKSSDLKVGDLKIGDLKVGDLKAGDLKISDLKVGDLKSGDLKNDLGSEAGVLDAPGVTKHSMVEILKASTLAFPLVFFESCDSDLGEDLTHDLLFGSYKWNGSSGVGSVYFSDRQGLQYETVNYGAISFKEFFSDSLKQTLDAQRAR
jgi:hypothetical protein